MDRRNAKGYKNQMVNVMSALHAYVTRKSQRISLQAAVYPDLICNCRSFFKLSNEIGMEVGMCRGSCQSMSRHTGSVKIMPFPNIQFSNSWGICKGTDLAETPLFITMRLEEPFTGSGALQHFFFNPASQQERKQWKIQHFIEQELMGDLPVGAPVPLTTV